MHGRGVGRPSLPRREIPPLDRVAQSSGVSRRPGHDPAVRQTRRQRAARRRRGLHRGKAPRPELGGRGFAGSLKERFPATKDEYTAWATGGQLPRGAVHLAEVDEKLSIASLVAQAGYSDSPGRMPRLRLAALGTALRRLADLAIDREATVHIPPNPPCAAHAAVSALPEHRRAR